MKRLKYYFRLYQAFLRIGMLCLVQYPMDSTIRLISIVAREAAGFLGVFAIANVVGNLGEWSIYGVCLIFSLGAMTEAISRGLLDNVWSIGSFVRKGKLDIFLIRPASSGKKASRNACIVLSRSFSMDIRPFSKTESSSIISSAG